MRRRKYCFAGKEDERGDVSASVSRSKVGTVRVDGAGASVMELCYGVIEEGQLRWIRQGENRNVRVMGAAGRVWKRNRWCGHHYDSGKGEGYNI